LERFAVLQDDVKEGAARKKVIGKGEMTEPGY
jgi:hypothetical protein